jgi:hypothetical protein
MVFVVWLCRFMSLFNVQSGYFLLRIIFMQARLCVSNTCWYYEFDVKGMNVCKNHLQCGIRYLSFWCWPKLLLQDIKSINSMYEFSLVLLMGWSNLKQQWNINLHMFWNGLPLIWYDLKFHFPTYVLWASIVHCATFDAIHSSTHKNIMITKKKSLLRQRRLKKVTTCWITWHNYGV